MTRRFTPDDRPARPFPKVLKWALGAFAVGAILGHLADVTALQVAAGLAGVLLGFWLSAWIEETLYLVLARRSGLVRGVVTIGLLPAVALSAALGFVALAFPPDPLGLLGYAASVLAGLSLWILPAIFGSLVVIVIETLVVAIASDFRRRLMLAILALLASALAAALIVGILTVAAGSAVADFNLAQSNLPPQARANLEEALHSPYILPIVSFMFITFAAIPAIVSAASKLATGAMERIHPLTAAMDAVARGERDLEIEEGGAKDFVDAARSFNAMVRTLSAAEQMERAFGVYVSPLLLARIREQHGEAVLPPQLRVASVFFADIRGFTAMSEKLSAEQVVALLNRWFEEVVRVVAEHEGYLNKFIGDAVVVVFNGPIHQPDHAARAVRCAIALQDAARTLNDANAFPEIGSLHVGIGIATGPMVCGNVGGTRQMEYTVIGDNVNLASRLTSVAAPGEIFLSEATALAIPESDRGEALPPIALKGKAVAIVPWRLAARPGSR